MTNREKALQNDRRIEEMAIYVLTEGTTKSAVDYSRVANMSQEELARIQADYMIKIQDKFSELKRLVKTGEFTMAELEDKVYADYGVMETPSDSKSDMAMDMLSKIIGNKGQDRGMAGFKGEKPIKGFNQDL